MSLHRQRRNTDYATLQRMTPGIVSQVPSLTPAGGVPPVPNLQRGNAHAIREVRANLMIVISGIPDDVAIDAVEQVFRRFGDIVLVERDQTHQSATNHWQCLIQYRSFDDARNAVQNMDNHELLKGTQPVSVRFARANMMKPAMVRRRGSCAERETQPLEKLFLRE